MLPGNLGFQLEPYGLFVAILVLAWISSLLIDPRVRVKRSGLERPLWLFVAAALASVLFNLGSLRRGAQVIDPATRLMSDASLVPNVVKAFTFFAGFLLVFYVIVSLIRNGRQVDALIKLMVACGLAIAVLSIIESRTGFNALTNCRACSRSWRSTISRRCQTAAHGCVRADRQSMQSRSAPPSRCWCRRLLSCSHDEADPLVDCDVRSHCRLACSGLAGRA